MNVAQPSWQISAKELNRVRQNVVLLDVREPYEYKEFHIENCIHIPLGDLEAKCESELSKGDDIVVYCAMGMRSLDGAMILKEKGFNRVRSLEGGLTAWMETQSQ